MSKRNIEKHILMNKAEAQDLQKKAKRACLSEGGLIRLLLRGYEPREKPDERFYDVMRELSAIGNNINQTPSDLWTHRSSKRKPSVGTSFRLMWSVLF